jgi:hypothetical protein
MSALILFAQIADAAAANAAADTKLSDWLSWFYVWGEPSFTLGRWWGGGVSWCKVVGLYCLMAWVIGWLVTSSRSNIPGTKSSKAKLGIVLASLIAFGVAALLGVLEDTGKLPLKAFGGAKPGTWIALLGGGLLLGLVEFQLWSSMRKKRETADLLCLFAMHAVFVLGYFIAYECTALANRILDLQRAQNPGAPTQALLDWRVLGMRIGGTYMGLVALARVGWMLFQEVVAIRFRRIYSIAWQSIAEANRSNRAPYVVVSLFVVVLAFTHWFLRSGERDAELSRGFVQTLTFLCSILLLLMIVFVAPLSMPRDISNQTIYTIVSKPVRRIELIWGRLVGYMTLVTVLLALFGGIGLVYLNRTVGTRVGELRAEALKFEALKPDFAKQRTADADQLESRMSARVPLKGSLVFEDAKKTQHDRGIDVGQEEETRSFVEGATESQAIWTFDEVFDKFSPGGRRDLRIPVESLLTAGSIEDVENRLLNLRYSLMAAEGRGQGTRKASDITKQTKVSAAATTEIAQLETELQALQAKEKSIRARLQKAPTRAEKDVIRKELREIQSPPIPIEMSFTIYRTTKGIIGEPVLANITARNRLGGQTFSTVIPIREYYTNKTSIPARVLVGSRGGLNLEVRCVTANQYLGMAEGDLYILADRGGFSMNFLKGLFGIWLQVLVLTSIGLFAGAFLSWPVAILTTLFFFLFGEVAFTYIAQFAMSALDTQAFGPFESMIRILGHHNMQVALSPTAAVVAAKTADSVILPVLSRLVFLIPNFGALDVTNTVAEGFAISWTQIRDLTLMGLGYALPFSVAGYFILKNREVAA